MWNENSHNVSNMQNRKKISYDEREKIEKIRLKKIFKRSGAIKPKIWMGKDGVTSMFIEQLNRQLKMDKLVKVKVQKNYLKFDDVEKMAHKVANDTDSCLVDVRGRTFSLHKPRN